MAYAKLVQRLIDRLEAGGGEPGHRRRERGRSAMRLARAARSALFSSLGSVLFGSLRSIIVLSLPLPPGEGRGEGRLGERRIDAVNLGQPIAKVKRGLRCALTHRSALHATMRFYCDTTPSKRIAIAVTTHQDSDCVKKTPLPDTWPATVKSAVLHVISLAQLAAAHTRGWAADSINARVRLKAENDRLRAEIGLLREEIRIKDARMTRVDPHRRPQYPPTERMAVLALKTARCWSLERAAKTFQVTAATIASWMKRLDEQGPEALMQLPGEPPNKFPQFVRQVVQRLKTLCPAMGKVKIAQTLARAGLHLSATTVGRMLRGGEDPADLASPPIAHPGPDGGANTNPEFNTGTTDDEGVDVGLGKGRVVTAKRPNHVWHVDLTMVPTAAGFWTRWPPFALPQCWPFCWWVAVAIDHFSRRVMGTGVFATQPTSATVRTFLGRTIAKGDAAPKYLVCDRGPQFDCPCFRDWCRREGIQPPRYGAIGKHGSIAVVERVILTLKCLLAFLVLIPYRRAACSGKWT